MTPPKKTWVHKSEKPKYYIYFYLWRTIESNFPFGGKFP